MLVVCIMHACVYNAQSSLDDSKGGGGVGIRFMTDGSVVGVDPRRPMARVAVLGTGEVDVVLIGENCVTSWRGGVVDKGG